MGDITQQINQVAAFLSENDIDEWIVPKLLEYYEPKIRQFAYFAYGREAFADGASLPLKAFTERAKEEFRSALNTYLFKYEHWRQGRDINTYLLKCLSTLTGSIKSNVEGQKKTNFLVCPGCKYDNQKEYLQAHGALWKCPECSNKIETISKMILNNKDISMSLESKIKLHRAFEYHTKKGYKCPECARFIPESSNSDSGIVCPYPDCFFFGSLADLEKMNHPVGQGKQYNISLQSPARNNINESSDGVELLDLIKEEIANPDLKIQVNQSFESELAIIKEVIEQQLEQVKRTNSKGTMLQKVSMYEAYAKMVDKYPEEMISYLAHLKQSADFPLQARIFQEYVILIQDSLPCKIEKDGKLYDVVSLLDDKISLFDGISEFDAVVRCDGTIPNNTKECYMGGRKFKNYGPCFIGLVIDIKDESGNSLKSKIKDYSFVQINMQGVEPGTKVSVKHYRIPSHYEMKSLVFLQRSRKRLVSSIYKRLHKQQRPDVLPLDKWNEL